MSSYYNGKFEVETTKGVISFEYNFDNEICPDIVVPDDWKAKCKDKEQVTELFDFFLQDPFWDDYPGLRLLIEDFDECVPFDEFKSGEKYEAFLKQIEKNCDSITKITISVIDAEDNSIYNQKVLTV